MGRIVAAALAALCLAAGGQAIAQGRAVPTPKPPAESYIELREGRYGDDKVGLDGALVVTGPVAKPTALRIDLCFPPSPLANRVDRISGPLTLRGGEMTGAFQSLVDRVPVQVALRRTSQDGQETLEGSLTAGGRRIDLSTDDPKPSDYNPLDRAGDDPTPSGQPSPNEILASVRLGALAEVLALVRGGGGRVAPLGLVPGCSDLRSGLQVIRIASLPDRAPALLAALKASKAVAAAEMARGPRLDSAVRLPAADEAAIGAALVRAAASALPEVIGSALRRDPVTGEQVVTLTRRTKGAQPLGLLESTTVRAIVGPDYEGDRGKRIVYVTSVGSRFVDPNASSSAVVDETSDLASATDLVPEFAVLAVVEALARERGAEFAKFGSDWTPAPPGRASPDVPAGAPSGGAGDAQKEAGSGTRRP